MVNLQEDRRVAALPAQVVRHCHQEAAEHREQHRDVMRLPRLLRHRETTCFNRLNISVKAGIHHDDVSESVVNIHTLKSTITSAGDDTKYLVMFLMLRSLSMSHGSRSVYLC